MFFKKPEKFINCKNCGQARVKWENTAEGWRLFNLEGSRHYCQTYESTKGSKSDCQFKPGFKKRY